jgi:hypothetical protein
MVNDRKTATTTNSRTESRRLLGPLETVGVCTAISRSNGGQFPEKPICQFHFFLPAFFAGPFVDAFLAFGDFVAAALAAPEPDFLFPNTLSQFCQNLGVVPVRTIGPPMTASPQKMSIGFSSRLFAHSCRTVKRGVVGQAAGLPRILPPEFKSETA